MSAVRSARRCSGPAELGRTLGCLSFEVSSDIFGKTTNPHNAAFSPGASTGGGGALVASQGSMIEVGTDLGGSTRYPAAYCGLYSVKGSHGRFPSYGCQPCMPGLEAIPTITAPLARTLDDLDEFWKRVMDMKPCEYDHTVSTRSYAVAFRRSRF